MVDILKRHVGLPIVYAALSEKAIDEAARIFSFDLMLDSTDVDICLALMVLATRRFEIRQAQDQLTQLLVHDLLHPAVDGVHGACHQTCRGLSQLVPSQRSFNHWRLHYGATNFVYAEPSRVFQGFAFQ